VVAEPEVEVSRTGDRDTDVRVTSQRCLDRGGGADPEPPEHWLWTYKRWKRRPTRPRAASGLLEVRRKDLRTAALPDA
jgi:lauroyl/myristoyl acyltransferase